MDFTSPNVPAVGAVFPGRNATTSLSYHEEGQHLFVASAGDHQLQVVDAVNGKAGQQALRCEREKLHLVEATHHNQCLLFSGKGVPTVSTSPRHAVSYWSLHDNKILRQFRGHNDLVTSIHMCPADDTFLTCSQDRSVRLWNLQQAGGIAELKLPTQETEGTPMARFDATGLVFAISTAMKENAGNYLHMYDARNYGAGAFAELKVMREDVEKALQSIPSANAVGLSQCRWKSLQFNQSGDRVLVGAEKGLSLLLDGFEGTVQRAVSSTHPTTRDAVACFSADDKTILQGNDDGSINCLDIASGNVVKTLTGHLGPVTCIAANPKFAQVASSCSQTALWVW